VLAIGLTIVYYRLLCRVFNSLLSFSPTALNTTLAKNVMLSLPFLYKALVLSPAIRIPSNSYSISSTRALQLKEELKGVTISNTDATITALGKIYLR
jgi:hypothetical protein